MKTKIWHPQNSVILTDRIGLGCTIHSHVWIGKDVIIGDRVRIQAFTFIPDGVELEGDVFVGPHVCFTNDPELACAGRDFWRATKVRRGAKIGAGAVIKAGITIGEEAVIGMGSVVLKDVPSWETWVGNPAVKMKGGYRYES